MDRQDLLDLIEDIYDAALESDDPDDYAEAEAFAILALAWLDATEQATRMATEAIVEEADPETITASLNAVLGVGMAAAVAGGLWRLIRAAYGDARATALLPPGGDSLPGAPVLSIPEPPGGIRLRVAFGLVDERAIAWVHDTNLFYIRGFYSDTLAVNVRRLAERAIREGLSRDAAGALFGRELGPVFGQSLNYWRGTAAAITTRAREFGRISAYEAAGTVVVYPSAVRDRRTSEVCDYLHGRPILVADLVAQRDRLLAITDPLELKTVAPWRPVEEVRRLVEANGGVIPESVGGPIYHFHCRTRSVVTKPAGAPDVAIPAQRRPAA